MRIIRGNDFTTFVTPEYDKKLQVLKSKSAVVKGHPHTLKELDRSRFKLHVSIVPESYTKDLIDTIVTILSDSYIHTFKHVNFIDENEFELINNFIFYGKSAITPSRERLHAGDQFTIYLPFYVDIEKTINLIVEIEKALENIAAGKFAPSETQISNHVSLRKEYKNDNDAQDSYIPALIEDEELINELQREQENHILYRYWHYLQADKPNSYGITIQKLVHYISKRRMQAEYKKAFLTINFGFSKEEKLKITYKLLDQLLEKKPSINLTRHEIAILNNGELSKITKDLINLPLTMDSHIPDLVQNSF